MNRDDLNREKYRKDLESTKVRLAIVEGQYRKKEAELEEIKSKIDGLKRDIRSLAQLAGESDDLALGLSAACKEVFRRTDMVLSQGEVRDSIKELGFPIEEHKHILASIAATLRRLQIAGEIEPIKLPNGRTGYRSKQKQNKEE